MDVDYSTEEARQIIIERCRHTTRHDKDVVSPNNKVNLVVRLTATIAVKFGIGVTAMEASGLQFASRNLNPAIVKVPLFLQFFTTPTDGLWTTGYLVMSFVEGTLLDQLISGDMENFAAKVINAIHHIHTFHNARPGPLDGGHARGLLWSENSSGMTFESPDDLQEYLEARLALRGRTEAVNVIDLPMSLCHMDISPRNILVGRDGAITLLDWGSAGFYPASFEIWGVEFEAHIRSHPLMDLLVSQLAMHTNPRERAEVDALCLVYSVNQSVAFPNIDVQRETKYFMQTARDMG